MKKTLVYIAPHLSTGGMPQYLFKQIESVINDFDVYCIEWDNVTGGVLVVQRNRIQSLLGNKLITLGENKEELFTILKNINPDVVHLQEIPELFMPTAIANRLYRKDRNYVLIETSHDSSYDITQKMFLPDKFLMVSQYQIDQYTPLGIPLDLVEYPIENKVRTKTREQALRDLGLDPNLKHVINVGLFTPRKNQAEVIEYARLLQNYPIQFHFLGNQADNFKHYWEPLMQNFPKNCKWWNERSDVDAFYEAADLFLFTSKGNNHDKETMPLVIREALSWKTPSMIYNLPVYMGYFDKYSTIEYLSDDTQKNAYRIAEKLVATVPAVDSYFDFEFAPTENKITMTYKGQTPLSTKVVVKDKDSNAPIYWMDATFEIGSSYWILPTPLHIFDFAKEPSFSTLLIEVYTPDEKLLFTKDIFVKDATEKRTMYLDITNPFDCLFNNYNEMFVERKYDCYNLNNLDVVLDIGANNGLFSLLMEQQGAKKIYAFEPNQQSLVNLRHMFRNTDAVEIIEKAVYTSDEPLEFFIDPNNTTIGSVSEAHVRESTAGLQKITVPAISLQTFIADTHLDKISLIKMDIEGAEYAIMEQLDKNIYDKVDSFLIEFHDNSDGRVVKLIDTLKQNGYDITQIRNQNSATNEPITYTYETSVVGTLLAVKSPTAKLLTVVVMSHNHEQYIEQCLDSILRQKTLFNFTVLVSDDCSTDGTYGVIEKYKDRPNVTIQRTASNVGPIPLRVANILAQIKSDYVTFLDADDYYSDDHKLQKQIDFLQTHPEYSIHSTKWYHTQEEYSRYDRGPAPMSGNVVMQSHKSEVTLLENLDINYIGFGFMFRNTWIRNTQLPSWFFEKEVFDGYWALINVLLQFGKGINENWVGGRYRITPGGHFGEKSEGWKAEQILAQSNVLKRVFIPQPKPILIVDAFFHDDHCLSTFKQYLTSVKKLNVPIMLITNSKFDTSLIDEVDYVVYDSNNRLFKKSYDGVDNIVLYTIDSDKYLSLGTPALQKHGLSVLSNLYHSTNLAKTLGYTHFYRIEYDCQLDDVEKIAAIPAVVQKSGKKGLVYVNQNKYVSYQLWYMELDYFTTYFPQINSEDDYPAAKKAIGATKDFVTAEEFIYHMIDNSHGGLSSMLVRTAVEMHTDYGNCMWNTITSPSESDKIIDGCVSTICRITMENEAIRHLRQNPRPDWDVTPEICKIYPSKVAFTTWNVSSNKTNSSVATLTYPDGTIKVLRHSITGMGGTNIDIIDVIDGDIVVDILINDYTTYQYIINKNTVPRLTDVYQPRILP
jgi:FkbM family methyltransferase